jgi:hypothetical protein
MGKTERNKTRVGITSMLSNENPVGEVFDPEILLVTFSAYTIVTKHRVLKRHPIDDDKI